MLWINWTFGQLELFPYPGIPAHSSFQWVIASPISASKSARTPLPSLSRTWVSRQVMHARPQRQLACRIPV